MVWLCDILCNRRTDPDVVDSSTTGTIITHTTKPSNETMDSPPLGGQEAQNFEIDLDMPNKPNAKKLAIITTPSEETGQDDIIEVFEKDENAKDLIKRAISKNEFLANMMNESRLEAVVLAMYPKEYERDAKIIKEGEAGDHFYISAHGIYDVLKKDMVIRNFGTGVVFGELAVLYQARRFASIRARSPCKVWVLQRTVFHRIMIKYGRMERNENITFLKSVEALTGLPEEKYGQVADLLKRQLFTAGAQIIKQGDDGDLFYIIRAGTVRVVKRGADEEERVVNKLKRGDCFGEQALLHRERRLATCIAEPPGTECLTLDRKAFEEHLGPLEYLQNVNTNDDLAADTPASEDATRYGHIKFSDLQDIRTLGVGSYGRVQLVANKNNTSECFALKYLKKHEIVQMKYEKHVYNERDVMITCDSPFIVKLYKTFRDSRYVFFLMEACLGGDLWTVLNHNRYFDDNTGRFIAACVIEGLGYMHSRNMIYRDLKPENLMIDTNGYVKLVDFGFARKLKPPQKTNTFVGTPEYVAPEIILGKGHDRAVDYWAMGVLVHELLSGKPAFRGQDHIKTYNLIVRGIDSVIIPIKISKIAQDLIKKLCRKTPTERLGYARNGVADIQDHGWFNGFNWPRLRDQTMKAPQQLSKPNVSFDEYSDHSENPPEETSGWDIYF